MLLQSVQPTAWDLKFRLFGVDSRIHPGFWLIGLLWAQRSSSALELAAGVATLFFCIMVHEMGHALCGKYYGDKIPSITLHMMGGYYMPGTIRLRNGKQIWLCLWGPLAGFFLGAMAIGAVVAAYSRGGQPDLIFLSVMTDIIWICMIWGLVNLLPIFPLDGGQIFRELIRWKFTQRDDSFAYLVSMVMAGLMTILALFLMLKFGFGIFTALLFGSLAYQNYQFYRMEKLNSGNNGFQEQEEPLKPWERDADWWKKQ